MTSILRTPQRVSTSSARLRQVVIISVICLALYCFLLVPDHSLDSSRSTIVDTFPHSHPHHPSNPNSNLNTNSKSSPAWISKHPPSLLNNRLLSTSQCAAAFPGLTHEIGLQVSKGPFTLSRRPHDLGPLIARIRNNQLFILSYARKSDLSKEMLQHRSATLHQIATALLTAPPDEPLPDTIIALNHEDDPISPSLSYSRPADPAFNGPSKRYFAMPHFSQYSWPSPTIHSLPYAIQRIHTLESSLPWSQKPSRAIWRGTTWFNNPRAGPLRQTLVSSSSGKPWADIEALHANHSNALPIWDFCRYRYVIHTEGVTYSGRFQYHQLCNSVILTPPIAWMQHLTHLSKPVFSSSLPGVTRTPPSHPQSQKPAAYPAPWVQAAWPRSHDPERDANIVFVSPDWTDLESTIEWLERHPRVAEGIARRQRELFDGGGYFSGAAETCYWRALIRGWSRVVRVDEREFAGLEEMAWEEFSLKEIHK
ncbi:uncharacterized protein GGS22DRAFT_134236 [Annulohypoxylon maeteangense]|uniref:uncharacterized protein n=1 Tax=Annulohypoxylon maeteangense TaxID=1927788 RepID=UPI002008AF9B|nr:uncharacterized protein GGS22DRAFT_134236 [Annulohypoxylon maeteangense]KAI0885761.1 hypothetical protein GGS22DRAFT_134236 [Annulohypoxylon maeteangense]